MALLLGATLASTDPATLVPIFRQVRIRDRVAQTVMSESAFNDAMGAIVTFGVLGVAMGSGRILADGVAARSAQAAVIGIVAGVVLGYLAALLIAHETLGFLMEYAPVVTLMAVIGAYLGADGLQASGFMAVFVFGIVLGNKDTFGFKMEEGEQRRSSTSMSSTTAFIMRMFIFILLGTQVDFALMNQYLVGGVVVVVVFMLVARPVTVFVCALPDRRARWSFKEMLFMCWTRETGVIPGALAGLLLGMNAPGAQLIASVTFIAMTYGIGVGISGPRPFRSLWRFALPRRNGAQRGAEGRQDLARSARAGFPVLASGNARARAECTGQRPAVHLAAERRA